MADGKGYILAGNLHIGTTDIKNESNDIVIELAKIEQAAKGAQKALDKTSKSGGNASGSTGSSSKPKETAETKALVIAMQKYRQELQYLDRDLKAGKITSEQYGMYLGNLKDKLRSDTSVDSFLKIADNETRKLTASEKELLAIFGKVESKMAGVAGAEKKLTDEKIRSTVGITAQEKAMKSLEVDTQKSKITLDQLTNSYKSGKIEVTEYLAELKKMKSQMAGTASGITVKGSTTPLSTPEKGYLNQWNKVNSTINGVNKQMASLGKTSNEVNLSTRKTIQTLLGWDVARQGIFYIVQYLQSTLNTLKDINTYIINIQKVTNQTDEEMQAVQSSASAVASTFGRLTTDYLEALEAFSRLKDLDAEKFAGLSLLLQNVGDVTAEVSQETLIATNAGFKLNGNYQELMKTIDAMNEISNNNATTITKMSEAIKVSASTATAAGLSFNQYIALIGTASAVTQREGSQIGNAMRTMFLTIEQVVSASDEVDSDKFGKAAKAIESLGVNMKDLETGQLRDVYSILKDVSKVWEGDQITKNQKMMFAQAVGNKRQADIILGIMNNWKMVETQLGQATNSTGSALKENETYMKSWEAHLNTLVSTVTDKMQQFLNSGDILGIVDAGTSLVNVLGEIAPAIVSIAVAYELLNSKSAIRQIVGSGFNNFLRVGSNIMQSYNKNLLTIAASYGKSYTSGLPLIANVKAMGATFASAISPMGAFVIGITAAITIYSVYSASVKENSERISKSIDDSLEKIKSLSSSISGGDTGFSDNLTSYLELYNRYIDKTGELGSLTSEEFSKMVNSGKELSETLSDVGLSFNDVFKYGKEADGTISDISGTVDKATESFKNSKMLSLTNEIQGLTKTLTEMSSVKWDSAIELPTFLEGTRKFFSYLNMVDAPAILEKSGAILNYSNALSDLSSLNLNDKSKSPYTTENDMFKSLTELGKLSLTDTISEIDNLASQATDMWTAIEDKGSDDATKWLDVATNLTNLSTATRNYLSSNYDLVANIDDVRSYLGDSIMTKEVTSLYNALKLYATAEDIATAATKEFVQASTGNNYTQDDASMAYINAGKTGITDEYKAEQEAIAKEYFDTVDKFQKKMQDVGDTQYTLGSFDKADAELIGLKNNILVLIQTYQKFKDEGNIEGIKSVDASFSSYGMDGIEDAIDAYSKLANATRDLSGYTKGLTIEQEKEVSSLIDLINTSAQSATNAQELAVKYIEVARTADNSELSQIELRQAYLNVADAMGLSTNATSANISAIMQLATANGALTDSDKQRIISQASVSESAKEATLVILRSQALQIQQQINTANGGATSGQLLSVAWYQTANNIKSATGSMQSNFLSLQNVMSGASQSVMTIDPKLNSVTSGTVANLQRQLTSVNQLIGLVEGLKTTPSKSEVAGGKAADTAAQQAATAAQKAVDDAVKSYDEGMSLIEDSISGSFNTGAISAKEALARTVIEMNAIKPTYDAIKAKAESTWTDIEKSTVEHYENLYKMSEDYSNQVQKDYEDAVGTVEDLQGQIVDALQDKYDDQHDKRIKQLEDERDAQIAVYDAQIEGLQKQIDDLNDQTVAKTSNLDSLEAKLEASKSDTSVIGRKRTADLQKEVDDLKKDLKIDKLTKEKEDAEKAKDVVKDTYDSITDSDSAYYDEALKRIDAFNTEAARNAEANRLIMAGDQQAIVDLLLTYAPAYGTIGQIMGQSLTDSMTASISTSLNAMDVVLAGTAAVASTYQSQAQAFLDYANTQMASLEARLASAVATSNSINSASGGSGTQISYTPPTTSNTPKPTPVSFGTIGNSLTAIGNNPAPATPSYTLGKNETTGKYFVKNTITNKVEWYTNKELYKMISGSNFPSSIDPSQMDVILGNYLKTYRKGTSIGKYVPAFSKGGISDQTQLALLHGTKKNPERILPANVTKTFDDFVYNFLPKIFNNFVGMDKKGNLSTKTITVEPHITMNNKITTPWNEKNALDNVERVIENALDRAGVKK